MKKEPQSLKEMMDYLVPITMKHLGISERTATLRIRALHKSGILGRFGSPEEMPFKVAIDAALQIPQLGEKE